ncbi:MAG TPA: hypothetical protein VLQ45_33490 [Thermoanaerobaculia bacterium]|nr:hypothetical protein [Thermoanaerobaculia bacterium]
MLRYTLLSDGSSDQALLPILDWLLRRNGVSCAIEGKWADLRYARLASRRLEDRIERALDLYPCDLLFIHRDAEKESYEARKSEILAALSQVQNLGSSSVCVIPVRMQEAWLLFDESAIRRAAGNPNGRQRLTMPRIGDLEGLPDPKNTLHMLLLEASGLQGRRRRKFSAESGSRRVVEFIEDFSTLLSLSAVAWLDEDVRVAVQSNRWSSSDFTPTQARPAEEPR